MTTTSREYAEALFELAVQAGLTKETSEGQTSNGTQEEPTGTDLSDWVSYHEEHGIEMMLTGAATYRTSGASKATPGFDVMDYGQEDYVFGSTDADARHWEPICA